MLSFFRQLLHKQRQIALFSEMVHSASLVHDDVIDQSDFRRGKPSVNVLWNHKKVKFVFFFFDNLFVIVIYIVDLLYLFAILQNSFKLT